MIKRLFDIAVSASGLLLASPLLVPVTVLVWLQDFHSPFYFGMRVGKDGKPFRMVKLRSMVVHAERTGVDSTSSDDKRITVVGRFIRRYKLDELSQLWNVLTGDMSLVGPRPNVSRDVSLYTEEEQGLLTVRPGITDISSIVFSDEGEILRGSRDPDLRYNQVIRPWKSRLGLLYIRKKSFALDLQLILLTACAVFSRPLALKGVHDLLLKLGAEKPLIDACKRESELTPFPPPGATEIVEAR